MYYNVFGENLRKIAIKGSYIRHTLWKIDFNQISMILIVTL